MKPLSTPRRGDEIEISPVWLVSFAGLFLVAGCVACYFFLWKPWSGWLAALSWQETPCRVVSSQLTEGTNSEGTTTYKVDIDYSYVFAGGEYRGSRYGFSPISWSGYEDKAARVARYPPGSETTCWVDPADASEAVLNRDFSRSYLIGLLPLIFVVLVARWMVWVWSHGRKSPH